MDDEGLTAAITGDPDLAKDFLSYLYPNGVLVGEEWFSVGDFQGAKGKGTDGTGSTWIHIPECNGQDKATGEKSSGPIQLLRLKNKYSAADARDELLSWLKTQGVETGSDEGGDPKKKAEETAYPWAQLVEGTKAQAWSLLEKFRGYPKKLISRIQDQQLLAHDGEYFCFPITNKNGVVVGIDRLVAHPFFGNGKKQRWTPKPVGVNRLASWYSIGCEIAKAKRVIPTESRWDGIALLHQFNDQELQELTIIAATGTSQSVLPKCTAPIFFAAIQNDEASERWAFELFKKVVGQTVKCLRPPAGFKDFNEALQNGKLIKFDLDKAPTFTADAGSGSFKEDSRPLYYAFSGHGPTEAPGALEKGSRILAESRLAYDVCGVLTILEPGKEPITLLTDGVNFNLTFQRFARTVAFERGKVVATPLNDTAADLLKQGWSRSGVDFPYVDKILTTPTILQNGSGLFMPTPGYHPDCKGGAVFIVRAGRPVPVVPFKEAKKSTLKLLEEIVFSTQSDYTRAAALMLGPTFEAAGFLTGEYPMGFIKALFPGAGKSTIMFLIVMFNGEEYSAPVSTPQEDGQRGGVGNLNNAISAALIAMKRFVTLDNLGKGLFTSGLLASALTGDRRVQARSAYAKEVVIDCHHRIFLVTSNGCTLSQELFERSLMVSLKEPPARWEMTVAERKAFMKENQPYYQGCRNAILQEWFNQGCPKIDDRRHRFTEFSSVMGGVTEITLGLPKLLDGLEDVQAVMTDPTVGWVHDLAKWMTREPGHAPQKWYTAKELEHLCKERGIHPPGATDKDGSFEYKQAIGRAISKLAKINNPVSAPPFAIFTQYGLTSILDAQGKVARSRPSWQIRFE